MAGSWCDLNMFAVVCVYVCVYMFVDIFWHVGRSHGMGHGEKSGCGWYMSLLKRWNDRREGPVRQV